MTQHRFRKDILLAVNGKQIHRRLKHLPARPITLTLFLTSWPGLASWQILGNGHSLQTQGVSSHKGRKQKRNWDNFWTNIFFVVTDYESKSRAEGRSHRVVRQTWSGGRTRVVKSKSLLRGKSLKV